MSLSTIREDGFEAVFALMEQSFPPDEHDTYEMQKRLLLLPYYELLGLREEKRLKAFMAVYHLNEFLFIEHLAVDPSYRNGGIGSRLITEVKNKLNKRLILEVELPKTELARRRIGFYERNGFTLNSYSYHQPALGEGKKDVPLLLMTTHGGLNETEFESIKEQIHQKAYLQRRQSIIAF